MERILRKWQPLAKPDCWQTGQTYKYFFTARDDDDCNGEDCDDDDANAHDDDDEAAMRVKKLVKLNSNLVLISTVLCSNVRLQKSYDSIVFQFPIYIAMSLSIILSLVLLKT